MLTKFGMFIREAGQEAKKKRADFVRYFRAAELRGGVGEGKGGLKALTWTKRGFKEVVWEDETKSELWSNLQGVEGKNTQQKGRAEAVGRIWR